MSLVQSVSEEGLVSPMCECADLSKVLEHCECGLPILKCKDAGHAKWFRIQNIKATFVPVLCNESEPNINMTEWDIPWVGKMLVIWDARNVSMWNNKGDNLASKSVNDLSILSNREVVFTATLRRYDRGACVSKDILVTGTEWSGEGGLPCPGGGEDEDESDTEGEEYVDKQDICYKSNIPYRGSGYDSEC